MRIWHFTECAYDDLPQETEFESVRVTMPSRVYDPCAGADLYHRFIDEWMLADEEGLDVMVNEHHQTPTCVDSAAPIMLGILARVTKRARLLILGNPIANRRQPVRVAEEMAMIDVLSRGRLECGFVRSVPYEIAACNSSPVRMTERMWEAHDLIVKAWTTQDGPFSFEGRFFHHRMVNVWPRPFQQPHPPIWISTTSVQGAAPIAQRGYVLGTFQTGFEGTRAIFDAYGNAWKRAGRAGLPPLDRFAYCGLVHVGQNDEEGRAGARKLLWYLSQNKIPLHFRNPPGYNHLAANVVGMRTGVIGQRPSGGVPDLDEQIAKGVVFCGSPDTVYQQIRRLFDHVGGFGHLLSMGQAGSLGHDDTVRSIRLLAREVLPRLRELTSRHVAA